MRLNKYLALATGMSRRTADAIIAEGRVKIDDRLATPGEDVSGDENIALDGQPVSTTDSLQTIMLNKPVGYVCSRDGQGSQTVYDLLPASLHHLKPIGRLDKDSSGLLLLTNDGTLAHHLTHPSFEKTKVYKIALSRPLADTDYRIVTSGKVMLDGLPSQLGLEHINDKDMTNWKVIMHEGRNRQIRRTFEALGYNVVKLHRTRFDDYQLMSLPVGKIRHV